MAILTTNMYWVASACLVISLSLCQATEIASFYGQSYLHFPLELTAVGGKLDLRLQFKAQNSHGLLLLANSGVNYIAVMMVSGQISVTIDGDNREPFSLKTEGRKRFNDLQWHNLHVRWNKSGLALTVNRNIIHSKLVVSNGYFAMMKHIFVGGMDRSLEHFYKYMKGFRGCIRSAVVNNVDIIKEVTSSKIASRIYFVKWLCDKIFEIRSNKAVSFMRYSSFVALPRVHLQSEILAIEFELKTRSLKALVIYAHSKTSKNCLIAEVFNGRIKLLMMNPYGSFSAMPDVVVNDGRWHKLAVHLTVSLMEISIDGRKVNKALSNNEIMDRYSFLFGGITIDLWLDHQSKYGYKDRNLGTYQSFLGCIRNIYVNSRIYSFRHFEKSNAVSSECVWEYACTRMQCKFGSACVESGLFRNDSHCLCHNKDDDTAGCRKTGLSETGSTTKYDELMYFNALKVPEGGQAMLTFTHINQRFLQRKDLAVFMFVIQKPEHGLFSIKSKDGTFTMNDIAYGKVFYMHDGSETLTDTVVVRANVTHLSQNDLSIELTRTLLVLIEPKNDAPKIVLTEDKTIRMLRETKLKITGKVIRALDADTDASNITFIVYNPSTKNGYFEILNKQGSPVRTFTQEQVNEGLVWFIHRGAPMSYIRLKATDGLSDSSFADVKIVTVELKMIVSVNAGVVVYRSWSTLSKFNLSIRLNTKDQDIDVTYTVTKVPINGLIQKRHARMWIQVHSFSQKDVNNGFIRYLQTTGPLNNCSDIFQFTATAMKTVSDNYSFRIACVPLTVTVSVIPMKLFNKREEKLSTANLRIKTNANERETGQVLITIVNPSKYGNLYKNGIELSKSSQFTFADVEKGRILYRLNHQTSSNVTDSVDLRIDTDGAKSVVAQLKIVYSHVSGLIRIINRGMRGVFEGQSKVITRDNLFVLVSGRQDFNFNVINPPEHGSLIIKGQGPRSAHEKNIVSFTNSDIKLGLLIYKHDDSENSIDSFTFKIAEMRSSGKTPQAVHLFGIHIKMLNDNKPKRIIDKVFHIVTGKQRIISINDLKYGDADINFDSDDLEYTWQKLTIGRIINTVTGDTIKKFKQQSLRDGNVSFQHLVGADNREEFDFEVTDGKFNTHGLFQVIASHPYFRVAKNTGVIVTKGSEIRITPYNLSIVTNIDIPKNSLIFAITTNPTYGIIRKNNVTVYNFTYADLISNVIIYQHDDSVSLKDSFTLTASVLQYSIRINVSVKVVAVGHADLPQIVRNNLLTVEESESAIINSSHLHVTHKVAIPENIEFIITKPPMYGFLQTNSTRRMATHSALKFTQADINLHHVTYINDKAGKLSDKFTFSVDTGYSRLQHMDFFIEIISKYIELSASNITVKEGQRTRIPDIKIASKYKKLQRYPTFNITKDPGHGLIEDSSNSNQVVSWFTFTSQQFIYYTHDDSESKEDNFTVVALADDKISKPLVIYVAIMPVNDEMPIVVINRALLVWKGSISLITRSSLGVKDADTGPQGILFKVSPPTNGHLAQITNTFRPIRSFTQELINNNQVAFVHNGALNGFFTFQVTDGSNSGGHHRVNVVAQPLLLTLDRCLTLQVYPNTRQIIDSDSLSASTNDANQTRPIVFRIKRAPTRGILVKDNGASSHEIYSFTQADVNSGRMLYQHTGAMTSWSSADYFSFEVTTLYAESIVNQIFTIDISYTNMNQETQDRFIKIQPMFVLEGREVTVRKTHLDITSYIVQLHKLSHSVRVVYKLTKVPDQGVLKLRKHILSSGGTFTQRDINLGLLKYSHDDSDTVFDSFSFNLVIYRDSSSSHYINIRKSFNITILPTNDEPFVLITKNPSLTVVEGLEANMSKINLQVRDMDTKPDGIIYTITAGPENGHIAFYDDVTTAVESFTQADINDGRLVFIHHGGTEDDEFQFTVTDGVFGPLNKEFSIYVTSLNITVINTSPITLIQGQTSVVLLANSITMVTNGRPSDVRYNVTTHPKFGKLHVGDNMVSSFTQSDLEEHRVTYTQSNLKSGKDHLVFHAFIGDFVTPSHVLEFHVTPLVKHVPLGVPVGSRVAITVLELDASELSAITGDNPVYTITSPPRFGNVIRSSLIKRDLFKYRRFHQVSKFSHEDVIYGKVYYLSNMYINTTKSDNFTYILTALNVQPASGVFRISLLPPDINDAGTNVDFIPMFTTTPTIVWFNNTENTSETHFTQHTSKFGHTETLIIIVVCSIIFLLIIILAAIVTIIWCRRRSSRLSQSVSKIVKPKPTISGPLHLLHMEQPDTELDTDQALAVGSPTSGLPIRCIDLTHYYENIGENRSGIHTYQNLSDNSTPDIAARPVCEVTPLVVSGISADANSGDCKSDELSLTMQSIDEEWTLFDPEMMSHLSMNC